MHEPLSQRLAHILAGGVADQPLTLNHLIARTEGRGIWLVTILLCLPFVIPVSIPGVSTVFGLSILMVGVRMALRLAPRLPNALGNRRLPAAVGAKLLRASVRLLRVLEKLSRPRRTAWMRWRGPVRFHALLISFMAFLLALPLPPVPPLTNTLPALAILLLALSVMEEDGLLIWAGYFMSLVTLAYLGFWAGLIYTHLAGWMNELLSLLGKML